MVHGARTTTRHFSEMHTKCTIMVRYSFFALAWCILDWTQTQQENRVQETFTGMAVILLPPPGGSWGWHGICYDPYEFWWHAMFASLHQPRRTKVGSPHIHLGDTHGNDSRRSLEDGRRKRSQIR
jgi:hypothetical protein